MEWAWIGLWVVLGLVLLAAVAAVGLHVYVVYRYLHVIIRVFEEMPPFRPPTGDPVPDAEEVTIPTTDGLTLHGIYMKARAAPRKGVILFGLEFGSNRWAAVPYTDFLRDGGYDVFTFEMRGQGDTPAQGGYVARQWVTDFEVDDFRAALEYLKGRPDRDPRGVGFYGLSKGGGAGVMAGAHDPFIRCFVTDGIFATVGTMVPYMKQWVHIFVTSRLIANILPGWYLAHLARVTVREVARRRGCHYPSLQKRMGLLAPRPLFMIHGGGDKYIKPEMAATLFRLAHQPKTFWLVAKAKHNQAFHQAHAEYTARVLAFFDEYLAVHPPPAYRNGTAHAGEVAPRVTGH